MTAILASPILSQFEATMESFVALAVLIPIIVWVGGSTGTQNLTMALRAVAIKDLTESNVSRVIRREVSWAL